MAKFDVFRTRDGALVVDCQADLLEQLTTRLVVPLLTVDDAPRPMSRLNLIVLVDGEEFVMVTQFAATIPLREMDRKVCSLLADQDRISLALDMLIAGF